VSSDVVYVGGLFGSVGGIPRSYTAAVSRRTGLPTPWDPHADDVVNCFALDDTVIYIGGYFNHVGGQHRDAFAAVSALSGAATEMAANVDQQVKAIDIRNGVVYVGGAFRNIGGVQRFCLAALEPGTGRVLDWNPDPDGVIWAMTSDQNNIYPVGAIARMGAIPAGGMSRVSLATTLPPPPPTAGAPPLQFVGVTNPCRSAGVVHFITRDNSVVDLQVFDMQGRRVRTLLDHVPQVAGEHELPVDTRGWPPGFYIFRLMGNRTTAARKSVVLP
jgi:hypothetical protein